MNYDLELTDNWFSSMDEQQRTQTCRLLWDEIYGGLFDLKKIHNKSGDYYEMLNDISYYLQSLINDFEDGDNFEACDIINRMITITKNKQKEIIDNYAASK